ncbi:hypothetical protein NEPAR06_0552 [Nematocida parisii]|nr:hypothetical protein NEPAR06_0552 [Nematocida parisii]
MNESIINKSGNKNCVLCGGKNPSWGCFPFGVLTCTKCAGGIRELGTDVCSVKSLLLDTVDDKFLEPFTTGNNAVFLDWYSKKSREDLSAAFFKTSLAKEYAKELKQGKVKEKAASSAPAITPGNISAPKNSQKKTQKKSKLRFVTEEDEESAGEEQEEEISTEKEKEVSKKKTTIRRVPGKILTDDPNAISRLGMFKNVKGKDTAGDVAHTHPGTPSIHKTSSRNYSRVITGEGDREASAQTEIIKGKNFIGSASTPKETVTDRLKNSLEKGKKSLLNTFKK